MMAWSSFSSARYVRSITAPLRRFFSLVRTNAPPLPGLTCWNSTTLNRPSGRSRLMPFLRSLVETAMDVLCEMGQGACAVLGHDQGVLDTNAAVPGNVDTGLDCDDEAGGEDSSAQLTDRRGLVDIEADAVPRAVLETLGPARRGDDLAADVVDLLGADAGADGLGAGGLRLADDGEDAGQLAIRFRIDAEGAGHVGAVALEGGAEVDHDGVAPVDGARTGVVVGLGRVLARRDDRLEGGALCAAAAHGGVQLEGEVLLADALAHERQHLEEGGVGDGGGSLHPGDLGGVLSLPEGLDRVRGGDEPVGIEQLGPNALCAPRHVVGLEADAADGR